MNYSLKDGTVLHGRSYDYKIIRTLGQGSFGITYLASVQMTGALGSIDVQVFVALKEFFMRDINGREGSTVTSGSKQGIYTDYKRKFIKESQNLSKLKHPNIINVVEAFEANNTVYYAMEFIDGGSLDDLISKKKGLSDSQIIELSCQIGAALSYMHSQKMLHLDLKPSNIMMQDSKPILIDFGLSKQYDSNGQPESSTTIGGGTPGYAPIEQTNHKYGEGFPITMDVYALGATMFKMVTGQRPPVASDILNDGFPSEWLIKHKVSQSLCAIIEKAMSPMRKTRYQNVSDVISDLSSLEVCEKGDEDEERTHVDNNPIGYFLKKVGDPAYGTFKIIKVPVTDPITEPEEILISYRDNANKEKGYVVNLRKSGMNTVQFYDKKGLSNPTLLPCGIPDDVIDFIRKHGFLSATHWENEESTTPADDDFGFDIQISFKNGQNTYFTRRVQHAHPSWHSILYEEVRPLLFNTTINKLITKSTAEKAKVITIKDTTSKIVLSYKSPRIGSHHLDEADFSHIITRDKIDEFSIDNSIFKEIVSQLRQLKIEVTNDKPFNTLDYSETPGELDVQFYDDNGLYQKANLIAFNSDRCGGNIINRNIGELSGIIANIVGQYSFSKDSTPIIPSETKLLEISFISPSDNTRNNLTINSNQIIFNEVEHQFSPAELQIIIKKINDRFNGLKLDTPSSYSGNNEHDFSIKAYEIADTPSEVIWIDQIGVSCYGNVNLSLFSAESFIREELIEQYFQEDSDIKTIEPTDPINKGKISDKDTRKFLSYIYFMLAGGELFCFGKDYYTFHFGELLNLEVTWLTDGYFICHLIGAILLFLPIWCKKNTLLIAFIGALFVGTSYYYELNSYSLWFWLLVVILVLTVVCAWMLSLFNPKKHRK